MKLKMDKLKLNIKRNKKLVVFLSVLGIIGIVSGSIFNIMLNETDKTLVTSYITNFFSNIANNTLDNVSALKNGLISEISYVLIIWLLGISVIGIPIILFMYFSKFFILGFSISGIISNYGFKGCLLSLGYIFPHKVINIIIYTILTLFTLKVSGKILFSIIKREKLDFKIVLNKYFIILLVSVGIIILTILFEVFVTPIIIKLFIPIIS